jgi:hypothetical protein
MATTTSDPGARVVDPSSTQPHQATEHGLAGLTHPALLLNSPAATACNETVAGA